MVIGRGSAGKRLPLILAFGVLVAAAVGAGCRGFFQKETLNSIAIQPPSPTVQVGQSTNLQAFGTFSDGSRSQLTSGVVWTSSDPTTVAINQTTGVITGEGTGGTATITAAAQGLSGTATATAFLGSVSGFEVCLNSFSSSSCPNPNTFTVGQSGGSQSYNSQATFNGQQIDLTTQSTWTPSSSSITCDSTTSPATCTVDSNTTPNTYTVTVRYGTGDSASFTITVNSGP
jgi:Bacterial Ig-like domain (group 2)